MTDSAGFTGAGAAPSRDDLPLPDYDHLTIGVRRRRRADQPGTATVDELTCMPDDEGCGEE